MKKLETIAPVVGALASLFLLLGGCGEQKATAPSTAIDLSDEKIPVRTTPVQQLNIALPIHASGMLTSASEQRLSFKIGGIIRKIYVDEGDVVRPGQLLAVLDKTEVDAQVTQAEQALAKSERDLNRVKGLYADSSTTLEMLENATTGRDLANESARIARFNQRYAEIRATMSGKIIKKLLNEGEITGPGNPVFVLFETGNNDWVVKINVSDRDWARLGKGMNAQINLDAYPDEPFVGKITELAPAADPASGLYPVEIRIRPDGKRFAPGLFAQVDITPPQKRSYAVVPIEAIVEGNGNKAFVFVPSADGETARKVPIVIAFLEGRQAVVAKGLDNITEVITAGAPYLTEKTKIRKL